MTKLNMKLSSYSKFLLLPLLVLSCLYQSPAYAFGDVFKAITEVVIEGLVGPGDGNFPSPPLKDRLINVADQNSIKFGEKDRVISGTANYKLAVVKSANVDEQIAVYQKFVEWHNKLAKSYASNPEPIISEANTFIGGNQYYEKIISLLKPRFANTIYAKDLKDAFEQGADYVAVVDIKLEFKPLGTIDSPPTVSNTADLSVLLIDKSLNAAPDILVQNTVVDKYEGINPDENFKKELVLLKAVRNKTFNEFETQLNKVIVADTDDPPVVGVRLSLTNEPEAEAKSKKKSKKKQNN